MKIIAIEEHFTTMEHVNALRSLIEEVSLKSVVGESNISFEARWVAPLEHPADDDHIVSKLLDVGEKRIDVMDEAGIDLQVLSIMSPGVQVFDETTGTILSRSINDKLAEIIRGNPKRYAGLATIAPQDPKAAATELERAITELGLSGACIHSHTRGEYLDDKKYWDIFTMAERLGVPIYIHPRTPSPDMIRPYLTYPSLATGMWGFAAETSLHAMRLICSGLFDQYPRLKIILGHLGEGLPFWIWRLDNRWLKNQFGMKIKKRPADYIRDNFVVTTSGMFYHPSLLCTSLSLGAEKILFAVDYPFESCKDAVKFIESAPIDDNDKEQICHANAEMCLRLNSSAKWNGK
jgi:5-carboxyvanillate decarboxylase